MKVRAVIFDVDGVLVRSMENHAVAYQRAFESIGVKVEAREVFENEGRRSREVVEVLARDRALGLSPSQLDALSDLKQEVFFGFGPLPLYPGVPDLVQKLRARGLRLALVTGTNRRNVRQHLGALFDVFDVVVTSDDVKRTKPHPEPYLAALTKLALSASDAVVVENASLGIQSAKAAGLRVIAVASTLPREALKDADVIVEKVADVSGEVSS